MTDLLLVVLAGAAGGFASRVRPMAWWWHRARPWLRGEQGGLALLKRRARQWVTRPQLAAVEGWWWLRHGRLVRTFPYTTPEKNPGDYLGHHVSSRTWGCCADQRRARGVEYPTYGD